MKEGEEEKRTKQFCDLFNGKEWYLSQSNTRCNKSISFALRNYGNVTLEDGGKKLLKRKNVVCIKN